MTNKILKITSDADGESMDRDQQTHHQERGPAAQLGQGASHRSKPRRESETDETPEHKQARHQSEHLGPAAVPVIARGLVFVHKW